MTLSAAAQRFRHSEIDATNVDFSDRISGKRQSYIVSSRRRQGGDGSDNDEDWEEESVERRLARLRREVEELKGQVAEKGDDESARKGVDELAEALEGFTTDGAQERLAKKMAASLGVVGRVKREVLTEKEEVCPPIRREREVADGKRHRKRIQLHTRSRTLHPISKRILWGKSRISTTASWCWKRSWGCPRLRLMILTSSSRPMQ
jgi:hypothetical protein